MNKIKLYILPPSTSSSSAAVESAAATTVADADTNKELSIKLKKFKSERDLFYTNLCNSDSGHSYNITSSGTNSNSHNHFKNSNSNRYNSSSLTLSTMASSTDVAYLPPVPSEKSISRVERTKSFLKNGLIKRWKSSKELFTRSSSNAADSCAKSSSKKDCDANNQNQKFINEKILQNLDEFERNFLLSAGRKILVKELRKNFEKQSATIVTTNTSSGECVAIDTAQTPASTKNTMSKSSSPALDDRLLSMDLPPSEKSKILADELQSFIDSDQGRNVAGKKVILSRHSFYNTYRNEYLASQNNHYSSNLSLNFCGVGGGNSQKTLTKTFNKYNNFIKSSSTINLSTIPTATTIAVNTIDSSITSATNAKISPPSVRHRHHNSVININQTNLNNHLTSLISNNSSNNNNNNSSLGASMAQQPSSSMVRNKNCNLKHACSLNNLSKTTMAATAVSADRRHFDNTDRCLNNDTQSLIITNTTFDLHDNDSTTMMTTANIERFASNKFQMNNGTGEFFGGSANDLYQMYVENNNHKNQQSGNYFNSNNNNNHSNNNNYNTNYINNNINNTSNVNSESISNNVKLRKCNSVNQIDFDLLKNELDDYVDMKWRSTNFGCGILAQRRYHFHSQYRKELDLEQKIDLEIKMREGSAKLLAACNNAKNTIGFTGNSSSAQNTQMLEAAKNLLTSNERMTAYMAELQRRKRDRSDLSGKSSTKTKTTAKVSLSEIRMPLMWRDSDHFKNKGDHRRFAVFCLVRIGTDIYDTSLLCPVDRSLTDVSFNDAILFVNVQPDFEMKLEVYAVMMEADLTIASTPRKIKNTIHSSISRTVGKRLAANLKDELNNTKIGPKFELIATANLTLAEASDLPHTYDLRLTPNNTMISNNNNNNNNSNSNANNKLPLFGHFCCRLAIQPDFIENSYCAGDLCLLSKGSVRSLDGYGRLQAFKIELWDNLHACENNMQSRRTVDITRDTKLKHRSELELVVCNMEEGTIEEYVFRTKSLTETSKWHAAIKRAIKEHLQWEHITLGAPMQLSIPGTGKNYFLRSSRQGSLYDQVPILESTEPRQSSRPNVQDVFAYPNSIDKSPKLSDFRSRANSSSSNNTAISGGSISSIVSSSSSRRSHWPFGK